MAPGHIHFRNISRIRRCRAANVNQADVQRVIRACQREKVLFRVTLQPDGAAVFEPAGEFAKIPETETSEDLRKLL
jgi:hypothetical protein